MEGHGRLSSPDIGYRAKDVGRETGKSTSHKARDLMGLQAFEQAGSADATPSRKASKC